MLFIKRREKKIKRRLIDEIRPDPSKPISPDTIVQNCFHCGKDIKMKDFRPAWCPYCGREPDPPIGFLLELAEEGKLKEYLKD